MLVIDKSGVDDFYHGVSTSLHLAAMSDQAECVRLLVINVSYTNNLFTFGKMFSNCGIHNRIPRKIFVILEPKFFVDKRQSTDNESHKISDFLSLHFFTLKFIFFLLFVRGKK